MTKVDFAFDVPAGALFRAAVDLKTLKISGGKASRSLESDVEHSFQWFILGTPGTAYTVEITTPDADKFNHGSVIDGSTKDSGVHWFTTPAGGGQ